LLTKETTCIVFKVLKSFRKIRIVFARSHLRLRSTKFLSARVSRHQHQRLSGSGEKLPSCNLCVAAAVADFRSGAAKRKVAVGMPNQQQSFIEIALVKRTACFLATLYTRNIVHFLKYCSCSRRRQRHRRRRHRRLC
jgi:hypothetical protein